MSNTWNLIFLIRKFNLLAAYYLQCDKLKVYVTETSAVMHILH